MKLFRAKVRLSNSLHNEVWKEGLTSAEIQLLRYLHGGTESVVEITHTANVNRSDATERARLSGIYSMTDQKEFLDGPALVLKLFGVSGIPLPQEIVEPELPPDDDEVIESLEPEKIEPVEPVKVPMARRTRHITRSEPMPDEQLTA